MKHELIEAENRKEAILDLIKKKKIDKALLFCNKKRDIEDFVKSLTELELQAYSLYNGMEEKDQKKIVTTFNKEKKIFLVCSDSVAKKVDLDKVSVIVGTELPTRANDYRIRLSYLEEKGNGYTFHNGKEEEKLSEINRIMNRSEGKKEEVKQTPKPKKAPAPKKDPAPKKAIPTKTGFGKHIPEFLKVSIEHLIKGD